MSHQDLGLDCGSVAHGRALRKAVESLGAKADFRGVTFREDCSWKPMTLMAAGLLWALSDEETLVDRFVAARRITQNAFRVQHDLAGSYQAFTKMLTRWTAVLIAAWGIALRNQMEAEFDTYRVAGYIVFGIDGSRVELARTKSNQQHYCPLSALGKRRRDRRSRLTKAGRKKANNPQSWITTMWHVGTSLPWDWRSGRSDSSERAHLLQMIDSLPTDALVTADAGFVGYEYWKALIDSKHPLVIRVGSNVKLLKKLGYAREREGLVYLWPDQVAKRQMPPLVLRLVVVQGDKHPVYLVTSVLAKGELSDAQVATIYRKRWGIEVFYRSFKQTFRRRKLLAHKAEHARLELDWSLVALWSACFHAQSWLNVPAGRMSVVRVLRSFRHSMHEYRSLPIPDEDLSTRLSLAIMDDNQRADKSSRDYPRKKQETPAGKPTIVRATRQQIQAAEQLKRYNRKKKG